MNNQELLASLFADLETLARKYKDLLSTTQPASVSAQPPTSQPAAQAPATQPAAQAPATQPAAQAPATQPAAQAPATQPAAQPPATTIMDQATFQSAALAILQRHGGDQSPVKAVLEAFNVERPMDLKPEQYAPFIEAMKKAFGEA